MSQQPELMVQEGVQAGLSAPLALGSSVVGSDLHSAVVIADSALLPSHFELVYENGTTALRAVAGEVVLDDGTWLSPGDNVICNNACSFVAGNTRFALRLPPPENRAANMPAPVAASRSMVSIVSGAAALVAAGILMFTVVGLRPGRATPSTAAHAVQMATASQASEQAAPLSDVVGALRSRLDSAGLGGIAITPVQDGSVVAQGTVFPAQMAAWVTLRQWYDGEYGAGRVLIDKVAPAAAAPSLAVAAVWAGASPYVINGDGDKLFIGASIGSGWSIQSIHSGSIIVAKGDQKVAIRY